jgi:hypothetical protein
MAITASAQRQLFLQKQHAEQLKRLARANAEARAQAKPADG